MIVIATDFGPGPYTGQIEAVLASQAPDARVIRLFDDLPAWDIRAAAYLLPAYTSYFPIDTVFLVVVDPGVGTAQRQPVIARIDQQWFVGPDNGLFELLTRRAHSYRCWRLPGSAAEVSATFHGRDLFAPAAARLARGEYPAEPDRVDLHGYPDWPDELFECVYCDHFGNMVTGVRASAVLPGSSLNIASLSLAQHRTFANVEPGEAFWYANSNGLLEIAVNQGRADNLPGVALGTGFELC